MSKNPFFTSDDVDDDEFLSHPKSGASGYILPNHQIANNYGGHQVQPATVRPSQNDRLLQIQEQKRQIEQRMVDSSHNSLGLLLESEKVGLATAEELNRQKEQLKATEARLDEINSTLNNSERHLNGIKSVFGGIRNYLFAKKNGIAMTTAPASAGSSSVVPVSINDQPSRIQMFSGNGQPTNLDNYHPGLRTRGRIEEDVAASVDDILDRNLEEMSAGLSRLKVLATGLNDELDEHDEILNRMDDKTGKVDWRVKKQNQTMTKLLK